MSSLPPFLIRVYDKLSLERPQLILLCLLTVIGFLGYKAQDFRLDASTQTLILETDQGRISGKGLANPVAMILSGAMMLDWLGQRHDLASCVEAGRRLSAAVDAAFADGGAVPAEIGGPAGTSEICERVARALEAGSQENN